MTRAGKSANVGHMTMTPDQRHERAKTANAALTPDQRSAAGKAGAAKLHSPEKLAERLGTAWGKLDPVTDVERRKAVRKALRAAGIIT